MARLTIDFSRRTWRRSVFQSSPLVWTAAAIGLLVCAMLSFHAASRWNFYRSQQSLLMDLQEQQAQRRRSSLPAKQDTISAERANAVNHAISQLNLPWRELLDALEHATPKNIALLSLEPDATRRRLRCMAEAKDSDAMIAYMEQLKKSEFFDSAILLRHEVIEQGSGRSLRFQFEAHWPESRS